MAFSIRTLLVVTLVVGAWIAFAPKFVAASVFALCCLPLIATIVRYRQISKQLGTLVALAIAAVATFVFYLALAGPWLMYTTYYGCAASYGVETPVCDLVSPVAMNVIVPIMNPSTDLLRNCSVDDNYDPSLEISISNFDPASWYTCEWMRYGMWLLTDDPPF